MGSSHSEPVPEPPKNEESVNEDFSSTNILEELYKTKKFSDVTFILKDKEIKAHKCVLATCSPVFEAMFSRDMQEKRTNQATIDDIEENIFTEMIHFVYTGKVENRNVSAADLLSVAEMYDLKHLKNFSQQEMMKNISVETAGKYFVLADMHTSYLLKLKVIEFIGRNSAAVVKTDGWKQLVKSHPHLTAEIFEYLNQ